MARLASVKAPASTPNSSASSNVSGIAAQLTSMKGPGARGPLSWMRRATSPLPVPVSPCSNTVGTAACPTASKRAKCRILRTQGLERWGLAHETVEGIGRGRRASTSHRYLRGEAWPGDREWPMRLKVAEIG